jgi:protein FAM32A
MSFVGGKLKLKGVSGGNDKAKKRKRKEEDSNDTKAEDAIPSTSTIVEEKNKKSESAAAPDLKKGEILPEEYLTPAELRYRQKKAEIDSRAIKKITQLSHRERLEQFNQKLASTTEHNDIPRISAAGNG